MKLAVHWAPAVNSCTPGWMAALDEGAHVGAAAAVPPDASGANAPTTTSSVTTDAARRNCLPTRTSPSRFDGGPRPTQVRPCSNPSTASARDSPGSRGRTAVERGGPMADECTHLDQIQNPEP